MNRTGILITTCFLFVFTLLGGCSSNVEQPAPVVPFFPERHGYDLRQFTVSDAETTLEFNRVDCVWVVGADRRPSDEPRVTALADALVSLAPRLEPAIEPDRFEDFRIHGNSFTLRVGLTFKDNSSYTLLIGIPALTKPVYLRTAGTDQVYSTEVPLLRRIDLAAASWLAPDEG